MLILKSSLTYGECGAVKREFKIVLAHISFLHQSDREEIMPKSFFTFSPHRLDSQFTYCNVIRDWWTRGWLDLMFALD